MFMMAVAVALAAGFLLLNILVAIFKENRRFFLKIKDFLTDKKVKCISGNTVFLLKLIQLDGDYSVLCFMYKLCNILCRSNQQDIFIHPVGL